MNSEICRGDRVIMMITLLSRQNSWNFSNSFLFPETSFIQSTAEFGRESKHDGTKFYNAATEKL